MFEPIVARTNASSRARRAGVCAATIVVALAASCQGGPEGEKSVKQPSISVWAAGDGVRVNPETGKYLEDRTDVHKDYPTGDYQKHNGVWDAAAARVTLRAARNEFVAFQVIVESDKGVSGMKVRLNGLAGPDGATISGRNVALFKAWYLHVTEPSNKFKKLSLGLGWYPDALLPVEEGKPVTLDIPDERNGIGASQRNHTVWVDIFVPRDRKAAPPGDYTGQLVVSHPGGESKIEVVLKVWDFALPEEIHCRGDIWNGSLKNMPPELELLYYQMAHRHRFQPGVCFYRPGLKIEGTKVTLDWSAYDERVGKYLDGTAFTKEHGYWGPGYGEPIGHMVLPFDCERGENTARAWPMATPKEGRTQEFEAVWLETARQVKAHFEAEPRMKKVEKIIFLDALDESYNEAAYEKMIYFRKLLNRGLGAKWFKYRIDGGYNSPAMRKLSPYVDLWVCATIGFDHDKIARFRAKGVEPWFYGSVIYPSKAAGGSSGSNTYLDLDMLTCRSVAWIAWKYDCGYCAWEFDAYWDNVNNVHDADRNWTDAINFRHRGLGLAYNGSGCLIYRGKPMGLPGPAPSIRLKAHRRGFQDYEYLWLLKQAGKGEMADKLVNSIIHGRPLGMAAAGQIELWKNNPEAWDAAILQAAEMLDAGGEY